MTRELTAATEHAGVRLDAFLSADGALTRSQAARLIAEGRVRVNGKPAAKSARLSGGETVTVDVPQLRETALPPQDIPLDVVYEDDDVIVVNKPTGLVVHPAPGHPDGTLVNALLHHCGDSLSGIGGEKRPGIVHRIDRDTSGLIIAAKNDAAHLALSAQLKDHSLSRTYECLVTGNMKQDSGTVDAPIGRSSADRKKMAVVPTGRRAVTHWDDCGSSCPQQDRSALFRTAEPADDGTLSYAFPVPEHARQKYPDWKICRFPQIIRAPSAVLPDSFAGIPESPVLWKSRAASARAVCSNPQTFRLPADPAPHRKVP